MLSVFDTIIAPAALRFCPDIILVSAGFDAHWKDPFQGLQLRCTQLDACLSVCLSAAGVGAGAGPGTTAAMG